MDCEIITDADQERVHAGQRIHAKVLLDAPKRTRIRNVTAILTGSEEVSIEVDSGKSGNDNDSTRTVRRRRVIIEEGILLDGRQSGGVVADLIDVVNTALRRPGSAVLTEGLHEYDVDWVVPEDALASYRGANAKVSYRITIRIDRPARLDAVFDVDLTVIVDPDREARPISVRFPDDDAGLVQNVLDNKLRAVVHLRRDQLRTGDTVAGSVEIDVDDRAGRDAFKVNGINLSLLSEESVRIDRHRERKSKRYASTELAPGFVFNGHFNTDFSVPLEDIPYSSSRGEFFELNWFVEVHIDVPWAKDTRVRVPVELYP